MHENVFFLCFKKLDNQFPFEKPYLLCSQFSPLKPGAQTHVPVTSSQTPPLWHWVQKSEQDGGPHIPASQPFFEKKIQTMKSIPSPRLIRLGFFWYPVSLTLNDWDNLTSLDKMLVRRSLLPNSYLYHLYSCVERRPLSRPIRPGFEPTFCKLKNLSLSP